MNRRPFRAAATALALALALALAACAGAPPPSPLTDPDEILAAAARSTADASSVHIDAAIDGSLAIDMTGTGSAAAPIRLANTTAAADLDLADGDARVTFAVPALLGLAGELIVVDGTSYLKSTLTGPLYTRQDVGEELPVDPASADPAGMLDGLADFLAQPGVDPQKLDDAECGAATCYAVRIELTPEELAALGGGAQPIPSLPVPLPVDVGSAGVDMTLLVDKQTTRLSGIDATVTLADAGEITADVTFSKWDEDLTVTAPPADQVAP